MKKEKLRGSYDYKVDENTETITALSHSVQTLQALNPLVNHSDTVQHKKKNIQVPQPNLVKIYNKHMGGVDRMDQNVAKYRISIRGKKWYSSLVT